jgi:mono/diheme cytochrome c family protein
MQRFLRLPVSLLTVLALLALSGCAPAPPISTTESRADVEGGRAIFESKGCGDCHSIEPPAGLLTISDVLATSAPELWYSGAKFKDGFLKGWLVLPTPIRPLEYNSLTERNRGSHVALDPAQASAAAAFLMSLEPTGPPEKAPVPAASTSDLLGRRLFNYDGACYGCHLVMTPRGLRVGGLSGPSLIGAGARLRADWIYTYLSRPSASGSPRPMPYYGGILTEVELGALAAYVAGLE